jgi:hypothetical protein
MEKISQFERRPDDTPIELWNVILNYKPSHLTMDEWIDFNSNDGKNVIFQINCVNFLNYLSFLKELFTNIELNAELVAQGSEIEVITLDSSDEETDNRKFQLY